MKLRRGLSAIAGILLSITLFSFPNIAKAQDEGAFTSELARSFSTALPEADVSIKGPLTLSLRMRESNGPQDELQVSLDRIWAFCRRNSSDCQRSITQYVTRTAQAIRQQNAPIEKNKIMAVIRSDRTVQGMREEFAIEAIAERIAGDLWLVCVEDGEPAARVLTEKHLPKLGLSKQEVLSLARSHLATALPPISSSLTISPDGALGVVGGDPYYAASRIALHDQWAALAEKMKGQLLLTVPDGGVIFFADSSSPLAIQALIRASSDTAKKSERPISPAILAWTIEGWQEWKRR